MSTSEENANLHADTDKHAGIRLSVVVPLFNERESLEALYQGLKSALGGLKDQGPYEIIFVDDGSDDGSFSVLEGLNRRDPAVKAIQFRKNYGKAAALTAGFREAKGELIFTLDADLQDDPGEIPAFLKKMEQGYDLISGWKLRRQDPFTRRAASWVFNQVTSLVTGLRLHDFNCGFKCYRREVIEEIEIYGELHRYIPALAKGRGFRIGELKVEHRPRRYGRSKYGRERLYRGLLDLLTVLFLTRFARRPSHLFGSVGLLLSLGGLGINLYIAYLRFSFGNIRGRYPLLFLGILLLIIGVQFISTGLLGEMIVSSSMGERGYSIRRKL